MAAKGNRKASGAQSEARDFDFTRSPIHLLRRAQQRALEVFNKEVGASGLTPRQFVVLLAVQENEGLTQTDLVNRTRIDRSTLADMISRLIKRELLSRSRTERDQRANAVGITTAGRRALRTALNRIQRAEEKLLATIPENRRKNFIEHLGVLAGAGSDDSAKPGARGRAGRGSRSGSSKIGERRGGTRRGTAAGQTVVSEARPAEAQAAASAVKPQARGTGGRRSRTAASGAGNAVGNGTEPTTQESAAATASEVAAAATSAPRGRGRKRGAPTSAEPAPATTETADATIESSPRGRGRRRAASTAESGLSDAKPGRKSAGTAGRRRQAAGKTARTGKRT